MAQQRPPFDDPFAGHFSQNRVETPLASWAVLQWHGGISELAGLNGNGNRRGSSSRANQGTGTSTVLAEGGFFIEDERIHDLGLEPDDPAPGFESVTLRLGGKPISGWGASQLHLAFLFADFTWEDRESGRMRFAPAEYERRRRVAPGTERELRGRTRCLVGVRELLDAGVADPVLLSVRGTYSAAMNAILREARRMADEATRLRRRAGYEGGVPREAFWVPVYRGQMEMVGEGNNTSRVALPKTDVPAELTRDYLIGQLVEEEHRRPGGTFDEWAEMYGAAWDERIVQGLSTGDEPVDVVEEF